MAMLLLRVRSQLGVSRPQSVSLALALLAASPCHRKALFRAGARFTEPAFNATTFITTTAFSAGCGVGVMQLS